MFDSHSNSRICRQKLRKLEDLLLKSYSPLVTRRAHERITYESIRDELLAASCLPPALEEFLHDFEELEDWLAHRKRKPDASKLLERYIQEAYDACEEKKVSEKRDPSVTVNALQRLKKGITDLSEELQRRTYTVEVIDDTLRREWLPSAVAVLNQDLDGEYVEEIKKLSARVVPGPPEVQTPFGIPDIHEQFRRMPARDEHAQEYKKDKLDRIYNAIEGWQKQALGDAQKLGVAAIPKTITTGDSRVMTNKIFLVHGRDEHLRKTVELFLHELGLKPIVLFKEVSGGKTIIEKFEDYAGQVSYAVVLVTPEDIGYAKPDYNGGKKGDDEERARQNVIFEMGYFFAKLGRGHVAALMSGHVTKPTDIDGVVYVSMATDAWKVDLAKEMRAAGVDCDMNNLK